MTFTAIKAYLAIPMPSNETFEGLDRKNTARLRLYDMVDEFCAVSELLRFRLGTGFVCPKIILLEYLQHNDSFLSEFFSTSILESCEILQISVTVPVSNYDQVLVNSEEQFPLVERAQLARLLARVDFEKAVSDLLVMANIAQVGSIELKASFLSQDDILSEQATIPKMDGWALQRAVEMAETMSWPKLKSLSLQEVWDWAIEHPSMLQGFDGTSTGRALNAFSRLFDVATSDRPMQLIWALIGLEALYCTNKTELLSQLRERSQLFLGEQQAYKKRLSQMYNFRSRFVHGDLDFPGLYLIRDARDEVSKYDIELLDAIAVAIAVLVATLQEIIYRNWDGLKFQTVVNNMSPKK